MANRIAFFDFDGTITTRDTLLEFIKFYKGVTKFYLGFLINSPYLVLYKLKLIPNHVAKQKVVSYFFKEEDVSIFQQRCDDFATTIIPRLIRPKAKEEIQQLIKNGATVVIVSASAENWIQLWSKDIGVQLVGTRLEIVNNKITGRFDGYNCHGEEKVRRIQEQYHLEKFDEVYAYGDTSGDRPMLALAAHPFMKPFR